MPGRLSRSNTNGLSTEDSYTKQFDSVKGQQVLAAHGLADNSTPVMVVTNADQADQVASAMTGIDGPRRSRASPS